MELAQRSDERVPILAELPECVRDSHPQGCASGDDCECVVRGQEPPEHQREGDESHCSQSGSGSIDGSGHASAIASLLTKTLLLLFLVGIDECHAGGEDSGESEKESTDAGTVVAGDEAGENGCRSAEEKAHEIFVRLDPAERGEVEAGQLEPPRENSEQAE